MRIGIKQIKYLFLLAPFLLSAIVYTQTSPAFADVLLAFKLLAFLCIFTEYLRRGRISKLDVALMAYFLIWFISTVINGSSLLEYVKEIVVILSYVLIIEIAFSRGEEGYLNQAFADLLFVELSINLFCLIALPDGLWKTYSIYGDEAVYMFLGLDNQVTPIFIVAELVIIVKLYFDDFRVSLFSVLYVLVFFGNVFLTMSATGILGCTIVPLVIVLGLRFRRFINIRTVIFLAVSIFVLVVLLRMQNIFAFIIEDIFNKDLTLTNRVSIWNRAIEMIKQKPLIGYGCGTLDTLIGDRNAHDFYLQILLQTGLTGFCLYVNIFGVSLKYCWREKYAIPSLFIAAILFGYMVCGVSEVYSQSWLLIILAFGYHVPKLMERKRMKRREQTQPWGTRHEHALHM